MKIIQTLLVLLGGLFPFILNAGTTEDIYFSHIGMEDGLSHSTIFAINQDKEGNLWFATYDGVNKYDGYNFTVYRHEYANPNSCLLYTSPSPRDRQKSRMPSSA